MNHHIQYVVTGTILIDYRATTYTLNNLCYPNGTRVEFNPTIPITFRANRGPSVEMNRHTQIYGSVHLFCRFASLPPGRGHFHCELPKLLTKMLTENNPIESNSSGTPSRSPSPTDSQAPLHDNDEDQDVLATTNPQCSSVALNQSQIELPDDPNPMTMAPSTYSPNTESGPQCLEVTNVPPLLQQ